MTKRTDTKENNSNLDFMDKCLFGDNKELSKAAYKTMLVLWYAIDNDNHCDPETLHYGIEYTKKGLNTEEARMIDKFVMACTNSMYENKEEVYKRKLKMKGND